MAEQFTLPGFGAPLEGPEPIESDLTKSVDQPVTPEETQQFTLPGYGESLPEPVREVAERWSTADTASLPTPQSWRDVPYSWLQHMGTQARSGIGNVVAGAIGAIPGEYSEAKRQPNFPIDSKEYWLQAAYKPLSLLRAIGGGFQTFLAPVGGTVSLALRGLGEAERAAGVVKPEERTWSSYVEPWAPEIAGVIGYGPMKAASRALGIPTPEAAAAARILPKDAMTKRLEHITGKAAGEGKNIPTLRAATYSTEDILNMLTAAGVPAGEEVAVALRSADAHARRIIGETLGPRLQRQGMGQASQIVDKLPGLFQRLSKMKPEAREELSRVLDPERFVPQATGMRRFYKSGKSDYWTNVGSGSEGTFMDIPDAIVEYLKRAGRGRGRRGSQYDMTPENLQSATMTYVGKIDELAAKQGIDPLELMPASMQQWLARANYDPNTLIRKIPFHWGETQEVREAARMVSGLFHRSRGVLPRTQLRVGAQVTPEEGSTFALGHRKIFKGTKEVPIDPKHPELGTRKQLMYESVADPTMTTSGWFRRGTQFPREFEGEVARAIRQRGEEAAMKAGLPVTIAGAERTAAGTPLRTRGSYARTANIDEYIKDPLRGVTQRAIIVARQLGRAQALGSKGEKVFGAKGMLDRLSAQSSPTVRKNIEHMVKRDLLQGHRPDDYADILRSFEAASKMSLSFITNITQPVMTAVVMGTSNLTRAIWDTAIQAARKTGGTRVNPIAQELGLIMSQTVRGLSSELGAGTGTGFMASLARGALKPFEFVEAYINQNVTARAAELALRKMEKKMIQAAQPKGRQLTLSELRFLRKSDINPESIIARGGRMTDAEFKRAAYRLVDRTQFLQRESAMPYLMQSSPLMRTIFQMKTFSVRASHMIVNEVMREAAAGNYKPMMRMIALYPTIGEAVRYAQAKARGRERKELPLDDANKMLLRAVENSLMVGGIGILGDALVAAGRGKEAAMGFVLGPGITDTFAEFNNLYNVLQHAYAGAPEREQLKTAVRTYQRAWTKRMPVVGPYLSESQKTWQERNKTPKY